MYLLLKKNIFGFIMSIQPQGKHKDLFPNKSVLLIGKEDFVT